MRMFIPISIFIFLYGVQSWAQDASGWICNSIFRSGNYTCDDFARANSTGGSYPQIFDAFNINPSSIPTTLTPVGVEVFTTQGGYNYALIKGHGKLGTAFSSSETNANFFSNVNNFEVAQSSTVDRTSTTHGNYGPNLNLGFAVPLLPWVKSPIAPILGASIKRNKATGTYKQTAGLSINSSYVHAGAAYEKDSNGERSVNTSIGIKVWRVLADYTYFENLNTPYTVSDRTKIFSLTGSWNTFEFNYGKRTQSQSFPFYGMYYTYTQTHTLFGMQWKATNKLTLGLFKNYVLDVPYSFVLRYFF